MKIPEIDVERVAPQAAQMPARAVTRPDYGGLNQMSGEVTQAAETVKDSYEKQKDQFAMKEALDLNTQLHRGVTDEMYGSSVAPTVVGNAPNAAPSSAQIAGAGSSDRTAVIDMRDTTLGGQTPQGVPGFLSTRGDAALKEMDGSQKRIADLRQKLMDSASSPRAQEIFRKMSNEVLASNYLQAKSHVAQQLEVSKTDAVKASLAETLRSLAEDPANDKRANLLISTTAAGAAELATNAADAEAKINAVRAEGASTRVKALLDRYNTASSEGNIGAAKQSLDAAERVVNESRHALGETANDFDKAFAIARQKDGAEAFASGVLERSRKPNGFIDEGKAIAEWTALPAEQRTDKAKAAFDHGLELAKKQESLTKADRFNDAASAYLQRDNLNDIPPQAEQWMRKNDAEGWHKLVEWDKEDKRQKKEGGGATDAQRWNYVQFETDLKAHPDKYAAMTPEEFKRDFWDKFAKADKERAGALFSSTHGEVKPDQLTAFQSHMLINAGRDAELFPGGSDDVAKWDKQSADFYYAATKYIEQRATDYHRKKREPPPDEKVKEWVDELLKKGKVPGTGYTIPLIGKKVFEKETTRLESMQSGTSFEPTWTEAEKKKASDMLQRKGMPVTDETIDATLKIVNGMNPRLPRQAQPTYPKSAKEAAEAGDDYGLDLTETPTIPGAMESVQD